MTHRIAQLGWLFALLFMLAPSGQLASARADIGPGRWSGSMMLPNHVRLEFSITISVDEKTGAQSGTISIPAQGVTDLPLDEVQFDARRISFKFALADADYAGELGVNGRSIVGMMEQKGQSVPFRLTPGEPRASKDEQRAKSAQPAHANEPAVQQRWKGVAKLPGMNLEFMVTFIPAPTETGWSGTVNIPLQGVKDMALKDVQVGDEILFTIQSDSVAASPPARFRLKKTGPDSAVGDFTQAGSQLVVTLTRVTDPNETVELPRPQTPKPPFPYTQREASYTSPVDGVTLAGTLTIPKGDGLHPAVLFITGSGAQDRDETILGHKPFWVIADSLSRRGVATLRVDDRGVGGSGGDTSDTPISTNVRDAVAGVEFLKQQPGIDPARIGLIGHSEGGWVAPMAAAQSRDIAFIVLLSAPGVTGRELLLEQRDLIRKTVGVPPDRRRLELAKQRALLDAIESGADDKAIAGALHDLALAERQGAPDAEEYADRIVTQQTPEMTSAWFRDMLRTDSRPALRTLKIPVLAIAGSLDLQVPPDPNLDEIRGALDSAGNTHAKLVTLPGLNHLLQAARTGLPSEYLSIQQTISPGVLKLIGDWIRQQTGLPTDD